MSYDLDDIDRKILRLLQADGRMTNAALAEAVGLTPTPMLQRMRKLEQKGVIAGYRAVLDPTACERATQAFALVELKEHNSAKWDEGNQLPPARPLCIVKPSGQDAKCREGMSQPDQAGDGLHRTIYGIAHGFIQDEP